LATKKSRADTLVDYAANTKSQDIPSKVRNQSKTMVLDTLGAMVRAASKKYPAGNVLSKFVEEIGGDKQATVIRRGMKTNVVNAALVNGTFGYYCDIESHHVEAIAHVAAVVVPAILAVSEAYNLSGKDMIASLVVGYDVETRVSNALNPKALYRRGFHPSAVAGCFGAAAAAGNLLGLDFDEMKVAFGLAGLQSSGLLAWATDHTENSRPFVMGLASRNGVTAALLAKSGFGAPPDIFEGKNGMFGAFSDDPMPDRLVEGLGKKFSLMEAAYKFYSCCGFIHPGADALLSIMKKNNLTSRDISEIALRFPKQGAAIIDNNELKSHNAQYILPILALNGEVNIEDILQERRGESEIARLSKKTHLIHDTELAPLFPERYTSILTVRTMSGDSFTQRVDYAKGTPQNPATKKEIEDKFRKLVSPELSSSKIEGCIATANELDKLDNISSLVALVK